MPIEGLVSLTKILLENNFFEFEDTVFRQKWGTVIVTKFAPGFVNIYYIFVDYHPAINCLSQILRELQTLVGLLAEFAGVL